MKKIVCLLFCLIVCFGTAIAADLSKPGAPIEPLGDITLNMDGVLTTTFPISGDQKGSGPLKVAYEIRFTEGNAVSTAQSNGYFTAETVKAPDNKTRQSGVANVSVKIDKQILAKKGDKWLHIWAYYGDQTYLFCANDYRRYTKAGKPNYDLWISESGKVTPVPADVAPWDDGK